MKKILCIALIMLLSLSAIAETRLTVSGSGSVQVSASYAIVSLGVRNSEKTVLKAQSKTNEAISAIRKALTQSLLPEEAISTDRVSIQTDYDYSSFGGRNNGYIASQTLRLKVEKLDEVGKVMDTAFEAGATYLDGVSFYAADTDEASAEALRLAVQSADAQAKLLAEALGLTISGIESAQVNSNSARSSIFNNFSYDFGAPQAKAADYFPTELRADLISVDAYVTVVYIAE